jgi:hypothetical protein
MGAVVVVHPLGDRALNSGTRRSSRAKAKVGWFIGRLLYLDSGVPRCDHSADKARTATKHSAA